MVSSGTDTTEGFIPHKEYNGLRLPVKLVVKSYGGFQDPMKVDGEYIYALPKGGIHCKLNDEWVDIYD